MSNNIINLFYKDNKNVVSRGFENSQGQKENSSFVSHGFKMMTCGLFNLNNDKERASYDGMDDVNQ